MNPQRVYVSVSDVFPNVRSDFETFKSLLKELSCTDTLFWCARLNLLITNPLEETHISRQQTAIDQFLTKDEIERINKFASLNNKGAEEVSVFFRGQLLELMRWAILYCVDHPNKCHALFEETKAAMECGSAGGTKQ